ncbi:hypothetical protein QAD02_008855 [Eretmocerus hayati]|uniref:Uncharacterized protein n=1 Tax=Eretmocerus hayati TaxID=131215 RepID=A0ACC2N7V0_9HYME|nr:hypothetical protein QAD02_008855 [Eretmocerus hayati]
MTAGEAKSSTGSRKISPQIGPTTVTPLSSDDLHSSSSDKLDKLLRLKKARRYEALRVGSSTENSETVDENHTRQITPLVIPNHQDQDLDRNFIGTMVFLILAAASAAAISFSLGLIILGGAALVILKRIRRQRPSQLGL